MFLSKRGADYQNPTTHRMPLVRRKELARIAKENDIFIIEDATYHLMCKLAARMIVSNQIDRIIESHRKNTIRRNQLNPIS